MRVVCRLVHAACCAVVCVRCAVCVVCNVCVVCSVCMWCTMCVCGTAPGVHGVCVCGMHGVHSVCVDRCAFAYNTDMYI